jgi:hypothetical protein
VESDDRLAMRRAHFCHRSIGGTDEEKLGKYMVLALVEYLPDTLRVRVGNPEHVGAFRQHSPRHLHGAAEREEHLLARRRRLRGRMGCREGHEQRRSDDARSD